MIAQFALRLICGMSLLWAIMPRRQVTSGFFRIQMLVVMGLGVLAALTVESGTWQSRHLTIPKLSETWSWWLSSLMALAGFAGSVWWTLERRRIGEWTGFVILGLSLAELTLLNLRQGGWPTWWECLDPVSQVSGAAVVGSAVVGMLLGHWYLTAPTMSIAPLQRVAQWLGVAGVVRLLLSAYVLGTCFCGVRMVTEFDGTTWTWLCLRWLGGILGPILVSLMVWRILKYRNTQAATGVLFVGVILAFIGDMTAALLLRETGLPL
jgi:hypothetical protein